MVEAKETDMVSWLAGKAMPGTVLIVLNQPIDDPAIFEKAWDSCPRRVVTDGAANRLRELNVDRYVPDFVVGDFDSVTKESRQFYESQKVPFVSEPDQNSTDFMKAMRQSHERFPETEGKPCQFLAFGALGGRVDHTWHSYLCLTLAAKKGDQLVLVSDQSITVLLQPGINKVKTPLNLVGKTCGYAPMEGDATVTTKGFEWDVTDYYVSFTTKLSTSNHLTCEEVQLATDKPLLFTVELRR